MESLISYCIQVNIYAMALLLIYKGFIQALSNYKFSRPFLLTGILLSFILPFINLSNIQIIHEGILWKNTLQEISINQTQQSTFNSFTWIELFVVAYFSVAFIFLLRTVMQIVKLIQLKNQSKLIDGYFEIEQERVAYSFFNWIFIGSPYSEEEKRILLRHEKIHSSKKHSLDILLCEAMQIIFWPNIILYKFKELFQELHEFEADELSWQNDETYLQLLLSQNLMGFPLITNQFKSTHLKRRIMRLKNQFVSKLTPLKLGLSLFLFTAVIFLNQNLKAGSLTMENKQEKIIDIDKAATFPGGQKAMIEFIQGNIIFPKSMVEKELSGKVFVKFIVQADGILTDFEALRSPHEDFTAEALKVMKKMPKWIPAEKDGKKVKMQLTLPINFDIPKPKSAPTPPSAPEQPSVK